MAEQVVNLLSVVADGIRVANLNRRVLAMPRLVSVRFASVRTAIGGIDRQRRVWQFAFRRRLCLRKCQHPLPRRVSFVEVHRIGRRVDNLHPAFSRAPKHDVHPWCHDVHPFRRAPSPVPVPHIHDDDSGFGCLPIHFFLNDAPAVAADGAGFLSANCERQRARKSLVSIVKLHASLLYKMIPVDIVIPLTSVDGDEMKMQSITGEFL